MLNHVFGVLSKPVLNYKGGSQGRRGPGREGRGPGREEPREGGAREKFNNATGTIC
jgi:hypothetical protein